jgi:broad specificity phosphatase PhoE
MRHWIRGGPVAVLVGLWAVVALSSCVASRDDSGFTTVILVRHAEKDSIGDDPVLTDRGIERARSLAHVLGETNVSAIYATQYNRTRQTAQPLADRLGLDVFELGTGAEYVQEMVDLVRSEHVGETVVVVSHSNTVPAIIEALGAGPAPSIDEDEYDDLFVVTVGDEGEAGLLALRYGPDTP